MIPELARETGKRISHQNTAAMYVQQYVELMWWFLIAVYAAIVAVFVYATSRSSGGGQRGESGGTPAKGMEKKEKVWLAFLIAVAILGNAVLFSPILPSAQSRFYTPAPVETISISVSNYTYHIADDPITAPLNQPVEFLVTSNDVTYGFGVFRSDGTMVFQMQVLPGYVNHIVWTFDTPGFYTIRSTEYAGPETPNMVLQNAINVTGGN